MCSTNGNGLLLIGLRSQQPALPMDFGQAGTPLLLALATVLRDEFGKGFELLLKEGARRLVL